MTLLLALLLATVQSPSPSPSPSPASAPPATASTPRCTLSGVPPSGRIARLISSTDGSSAAKAYRVRSIQEEYRILDALGLCPGGQSLTMSGGHPYDVLDAIDARTGEARVLWFDIRSFF
jgi:hypothetical protein